MYLAVVRLIAFGIASVASIADFNPPQQYTRRRDSPRMLEDDKLLTVFISEGETTSLFYLLQQNVTWLSFTVTPCGLPISWDIVYRPPDNPGKINENEAEGLPETDEEESRCHDIENAHPGLYTIRLKSSRNGRGWVQLFVTTMGPKSLLRPTTELIVTSRRQKGQLSIRWRPSPVDPQYMAYWLVVNPVNPFKSLCRAHRESNGLDITRKQLFSGFQYLSGENSPKRPDIIIDSTGSRPSGIIKGLRTDVDYYVDLFAVNNVTKLSFLYGTTKTRYKRARPVLLKDGQLSVSNIRRMDGRVNFRFKVRGKSVERLEWYVVACGQGAVVDVEVRHQKIPVIQRTRVFGYARMQLENPVGDSSYVLRVNSTDPEVLSRITSIQVVGTARGLTEPVLPSMSSLHEFKAGRTCRSVWLGWLPSVKNPHWKSNDDTPQPFQYCVMTREVSRSDPFTPVPDQCRISVALRRFDFHSHQCFHVSQPPKLIKKEVKHLSPGRFYDVQVTVRHGKSRTLSYQMIRVRTKPDCISQKTQ